MLAPAARIVVVAIPCALMSLAPTRLASQPHSPWPVTFVDVADRAGLRAASIYGGVDRKRFIIETNGAGVAFLDYDNDGWVDALVLNGTRLKPGTREAGTYAPGKAPLSRLYRNNHD